MTIKYHRQFRKNYRKRIEQHPHLEKQFKDRLRLLLENPKHPLLKDHKLAGRLKEYRAFSVTGDTRVVYKIVNNTLLLYNIGTHSQVY